MKLSKILGISHTCPSCHTEFVRLDTLKGLSFCPHCHQHVRFSPQPTKRWSDDWSFAKRLVASAVLAALATALFFLAPDIEWLKTGAEIISHVMIGAFLLFGAGAVGVAIWGRGRLNSHAIVECGVDDFEVVKQERCPEYKRFMQSASGQLQSVVCPACQSMRLADRYWYKTCWGAQGHKIEPISEVDDLKFYGCLNCGKRFEVTKQPSTYWRTQLVAGLVLMFGVVVGVGGLILGTSDGWSHIKLLLAFGALTLYSMLAVFPSRQTHDIYADSHLQEILPNP